MSEPAARQLLREAREKAAAERVVTRVAREAGPVSVIEQAAALMRRRANDAYPGPWQSDENDDCWQLHSAPDRRFPTAQILKAPKHGTLYAEYWPDKATGEHITSWHPGVALAVAGWLDSWAGIEWDPQKYRSGDQEAAWRVAHAYLGFEMRTPLAAPQAVYGDCGCRVGECGCRGEVEDGAERVTDGIVEFIKAQMALDEQTARNAGATRSGAIASWHVDCRCLDKDASAHDENCWTCRVEGDNIIIYDEGGHDEYQARHIARYDPVTVLAEIEAKRYLLEWCAEVTAHFDWSILNQPRSLRDDPNARATHTAIVALKSMAAPYAGQPGYKSEWRLP